MDKDVKPPEAVDIPDFNIEVVADDSELLDHPIIGAIFER